MKIHLLQPVAGESYDSFIKTYLRIFVLVDEADKGFDERLELAFLLLFLLVLLF